MKHPAVSSAGIKKRAWEYYYQHHPRSANNGEFKFKMLPVGSDIERREIPFITLIIITLNLMAFMVEALMSDEVLSAVLAAQSYGPQNWYNPFAVFTSFFLHGSVSHFFFNMLFLWIFGAPLEDRLGWKKYLAFYIGAGVASAFLYTGMQYVQAGPDAIGAIGASGAVSGMMGLFVYRCYYARLKMVIDPIFFQFKFDVPALPFVLFFYILPDIYAGINYSTVTGIAHWGHVGGFAFGIIAARLSSFGHEGRVEQLREKVLKKLADGKGLAAVEKELKKLLDLVPDDPEVKVDLARLYAGSDRKRESTLFYIEAINTYFVKEPIAAAYKVMEAAQKLRAPLDFKYHLRAAETMIKHGDFEDARKVLLMALRRKLTKSPVIERTLALFARLNWHLGRDVDAKKAYAMLKKGFPGGRSIHDVQNTFEMKQGEVFIVPDKPGSAPATGGDDTPAREKAVTWAQSAMGVMAEIMDIAVDPFFIIAWIVINFGLRPVAYFGFWPEALAANYYGFLNQLLIFFLVLLATIDYRTGLFHGLGGRMAARRAEKKFDELRTIEEARMAEKKEDFKRAVRLYERHLLNDPEDLSARYNLARIYQNRMRDKKKAENHFRLMLQIAPPTSPFHGSATDCLVEMGLMEDPGTEYGEPGDKKK